MKPEGNVVCAMRAATIVLTVFALFACHIQAYAQTAPQQAPGPAQWQMAVVFRVSNGTHVYAGTVANPEVPPVLGPRKTDAVPGKPPLALENGFEVWLLADGRTLGLAYDPSTEAFATFASPSQEARQGRDDGSLARLLRGAQPAASAPSRRPDCVSVACTNGQRHSLQEMCDRADMILVGRVAGILREDYSPHGTHYPLQHTVYVVAAEEYLKQGSAGAPRVVKVWQFGGSLPYTGFDDSPGGTGSETEGDAMLRPGDRYCLFLRTNADLIREFGKIGRVTSTFHGRTGRARELDEFEAVDGWCGKLLLRGGLSLPPGQTGKPYYDAWQFDTGPQIVNVSEDSALAAIRAALAEGPRRP